MRRDDRFDERIASIDSAENRAAESKDSRDILRREHARFLRVDQSVEAVLEPDDRHAGVGRRFDDGSNDGIEAGGVAAAGEDANFFNGGHSGEA